jgi:prevent-host-death family protein
MKTKQVPFSKARENLTAVLDAIEKSGEPVTILRRGRPAAVILSQEMFDHQFTSKKRTWRLAGSMKIKPGVDIDQAIKAGRETLRKALKKRIEQDKGLLK